MNNDISTDIDKVKRRITKIFKYGERTDKLALASMLNLQMETNRFEIIEAKKEQSTQRIVSLQNQIKMEQDKLTKLEREANPFDFSTDETNKEPTTIVSGRKGGANGRDKCPTRKAFMELIGTKVMTSQEIANKLDVSKETVLRYAKKLKIPRKGARSGLFFISDEADGFKTINGEKNKPTTNAVRPTAAEIMASMNPFPLKTAAQKEDDAYIKAETDRLYPKKVEPTLEEKKAIEEAFPDEKPPLIQPYT